MIDIVKEKKQLRKILSLRREKIKTRTTNVFNIKLFKELANIIDLENITTIASFNSIKSEISTNELNNYLMNLKKTLSFPIIEKENNALVFRSYKFNENLNIGKFNIKEPSKFNEEVLPQLFFVPCLGFDLNGFRIGYGGGYYDKTFTKLKNCNFKFVTVGFAFDKQLINLVPIEEFDYKLDFVLTEKQLYSFK